MSGSFDVQTFPHPPQFSSSSARFLHPLAPQQVSPLMSQQEPAQHSPVSKGPEHFKPQSPQFLGSDPVSTQLPRQAFVPSWHRPRHWPPPQSSPARTHLAALAAVRTVVLDRAAAAVAAALARRAAPAAGPAIRLVVLDVDAPDPRRIGQLAADRLVVAAARADAAVAADALPADADLAGPACEALTAAAAVVDVGRGVGALAVAPIGVVAVRTCMRSPGGSPRIAP